jgi:xylose isomerase
MFFLVKLLEESGYEGMRHFDSHAYRTEDEAGVWAFAAGSMRTYNILRDKARRFAADREIQRLLKEVGANNGNGLGSYSREKAAKLKDQAFEVDALARRGLAYERLDQLVVDLLLGAR